MISKEYLLKSLYFIPLGRFNMSDSGVGQARNTLMATAGLLATGAVVGASTGFGAPVGAALGLAAVTLVGVAAVSDVLRGWSGGK
jgi:hypothetical protein